MQFPGCSCCSWLHCRQHSRHISDFAVNAQYADTRTQYLLEAEIEKNATMVSKAMSRDTDHEALSQQTYRGGLT